MKTKIFSVFPACGKTWLCEHQKQYDLKILDSDSSRFSWIVEETEDPHYAVIDNGEMKPVVNKTKTRNPDFPANYIKHIKENMGQYDYIFVSSHASVREEWIGRCFIRDKRGESGCNPDVLYDNWYQWLRKCEVTGCNHEEIVLCSGQHLSDYIFGKKIVL